jgi:hypothetical protein
MWARALVSDHEPRWLAQVAPDDGGVELMPSAQQAPTLEWIFNFRLPELQWPFLIRFAPRGGDAPPSVSVYPHQVGDVLRAYDLDLLSRPAAVTWTVEPDRDAYAHAAPYAVLARIKVRDRWIFEVLNYAPEGA